MPHEVTLPNGFVISDDRARLDLHQVHDWLSDTYWAASRPLEQTVRSWSHCLCFGIHTPGGELAGFGRLLTDFTFRAHLGDVFIDPAYRGRGLGKALVATILAHPALAGVDHWTLTTSDAHTLYARHGFHLAPPDGKWMSLDRTRPHPGQE